MRLTLLIVASLHSVLRHAGAQQRVILFIGDGVGVSYWTAARFASESLAVSQFKIMGLVDTRSANSPITESAAGATAYAIGVRTFNGAIGVGPDSQPRETVLEAAKKHGMGDRHRRDIERHRCDAGGLRRARAVAHAGVRDRASRWPCSHPTSSSAAVRDGLRQPCARIARTSWRGCARRTPW